MIAKRKPMAKYPVIRQPIVRGGNFSMKEIRTAVKKASAMRKRAEEANRSAHAEMPRKAACA